jgi:hypothetical protein
MIKLKPKEIENNNKDKFNLFDKSLIPGDSHSKQYFIDYYYEYYSRSKQNVYYELIGYLFEILGFTKCSVTREGDTNNRIDALILEINYTIPIEIKSPTEISYINIKSISQALENKIILTSRNLFLNNFDDTSLVVAHNYPNTRSEVNDLIEYYYNSYKIVIGCIDFKTLLTYAYDVVILKKTFDKEKFKKLKGYLE